MEWAALWMACSRGWNDIVKIMIAGRGGGGGRIDVKKEAFCRESGWNNVTAAEIARKKGDHVLADLFDEHGKHPMEVMVRMRKELSKIFLFFFPPLSFLSHFHFL